MKLLFSLFLAILINGFFMPVSVAHDSQQVRIIRHSVYFGLPPLRSRGTALVKGMFKNYLEAKNSNQQIVNHYFDRYFTYNKAGIVLDRQDFAKLQAQKFKIIQYFHVLAYDDILELKQKVAARMRVETQLYDQAPVRYNMMFFADLNHNKTKIVKMWQISDSVNLRKAMKHAEDEQAKKEHAAKPKKH